MKAREITEGSLLVRGSRYRLVTEVWSSATNETMRASHSEMRRVGLYPPEATRRVQYLPVNADCSPLKTNEHGRTVGWRWADVDTLAAWAKKKR